METPATTRTLAPELSTPETPGILRIWLPPQFDPSAQTPAAELLRARLELFAALHPETHLEVRLKSETGPGGLLASLSTASVSAPLILPDVVALPRPLLEAAAIKAIIYPLEELVEMPAVSNGFPFTSQLGFVQGGFFGVPFAADFMILTYDPVVLPVPPANWAALLDSGEVLGFPASDPLALFTLLHYRSLGGKVLDEDGRPALDSDLLVKVLAAFQQANTLEVLPYWLSQYENDAQVWQALSAGEIHLASVWASEYLNHSSQAGTHLAATRLPPLGDQPYTLSTGWVWAIANPDPKRQALASELIQFLSESEFLAMWDAAIGYIPPTVSAIQAWQPNLASPPKIIQETQTPSPTNSASETVTPTLPPAPDFQALAIDLSGVAELLPPNDILAVLGPALRQASLDVLKQQAQPEDAAGAAIATLGGP